MISHFSKYLQIIIYYNKNNDFSTDTSKAPLPNLFMTTSLFSLSVGPANEAPQTQLTRQIVD